MDSGTLDHTYKQVYATMTACILIYDNQLQLVRCSDVIAHFEQSLDGDDAAVDCYRVERRALPIISLGKGHELKKIQEIRVCCVQLH